MVGSLLLFMTGSYATEEPVGRGRITPPSLTTPRPQGDFQRIAIPLKQAGNLVVIEARINGKIGNFILDTGAPYLVLNKTYFREEATGETRTVGDLTGRPQEVQTTVVNRLEIRDLYYEKVEADLADLGAIENKRGIKILGLMGVNLFLELELELDLTRFLLTIYRLNRKGERLAGQPQETESSVQFPFTLAHDVLLLKGKVNGKKLKLCLDTGAEVVVLSNRLPEEVYELVRITQRKQLMGVSGETTEVLYGKLLGLDVGYPLRNTPVIIADLDLISRSYGLSVDGIIGYDLLRQGIVSINFKTRQLKINPF